MKQSLCLAILILLLVSCKKRENYFEKSWTNIDDRVWIGSEFWSNRLQDWKIQNGRLECIQNKPKLKMRTTHLINQRLGNKLGNFSVKVTMGALQLEQNSNASGGILLGAGSKLDVFGASLIQQKEGPGAGLFIGITAGGNLFVKDMENGKDLKISKSKFSEKNDLLIEASMLDANFNLTLKNGESILNINNISPDRLIGNIALVSDPGTGNNSGSFWFNNLEVWGNKFELLKESIGPIISTQYTLGGNILKMTAQMAPIAKTDSQEVILEIEKEGHWKEISKTNIITPGYTATFRVTDWDSSINFPYRVSYVYRSTKKDQETAYWNGIIRHDPIEKEEIVIAGFTGNHNIAHPGLSGSEGTFNFDFRQIWYPHSDLVEKITTQDPDVLFFSGDQIYEGNSPTFADRENYELDYLYKWYLYCLAYRHLTKEIPTISIPDDHDIYQGNLWGQDGKTTDVDNKGGYVHPAWFVQMVERTQCSNLPDPYDPTPIDQNIGVYYCSLTYGGIGFAILEDRKFKSGCSDNPFAANRPDFVINPDFDASKLDLPGKKLLGNRQLKFLDDWGRNWKDQDMKIALSQTIFANMATHLGPDLIRVNADLDSNGWPQTGRNKAIDALRKSFVFHLAGDQHLASIVQHGIDDWGDGIYSFCVPSVANFYPRTWWPDSIGLDRPDGAPQNMGKHRDGFENFVTVYGVTNPSSFTNISTHQEPLSLHDKMPGYGIVKMNKKDRTIRMECWPRYADPSKEEQQYEGWPKTISQFDNYGKKALAYLPTIHVTGILNPVVEIFDEKTEELVYSIRIKGNEFKPKVFRKSSFKIVVKDTEKDVVKIFEGVLPSKSLNETLVFDF